MRALSSQEQQVVKAPGYAARLRVRVADGGGTLRDMTALDLAGGRDFTRSIRVEDGKDADFATCTFVLRRQLERFWNVSPLVTTSKLNLVSGVYSPLLAEGRLCVVEAYMLPADIQPASGDWREVFRGRVGGITESQDTVEVRAFDLMHELSTRKRFLEVERKYGSGGGVAVQTVIQQIINHAHGAPFVPSGAYTNRDRVIPTTANGFWYQSESTASAGTEPTWPTTVGNTVTSGSVTFRCMGTVPQLYTPVSPSWNISPEYNQKRVACWSAIRLLADQVAWDLRQRWDSGTAAWRLTFSEPPRSKSSPDFTFYPDTTDASGVPVPSFLEIPNAHTGVEDVTNVWAGTYSDPADLDPAGQKKRKTVTRRDTTSIDANGWLWMGFSEDAASQIDTQAKMERMLDGLLADTKDAKITHERVLPLFWAVELDDLIRWKADGYVSTSDLDLAVVGFAHEQGESGPATTRLTCRGKPAGGFERWRARGFDVAARDSAPYNGPDAPTGVTVTKVQGGLSVQWTAPTAGQKPVEYEVHASTSSGFTPNSSTLKGTTDGTAKTLGDLLPGTTYYVKVVPRDVLRDRGTASAEASSAAGYTPPRAMSPTAVYDRLPFNPDFEIQSDANSPPDAWTMVAGTWVTDMTVDTGAFKSGSQSIKVVATTANPSLRSPYFPVEGGRRYFLRGWAKTSSASPAANPLLRVRWFSDSSGSEIDSGTLYGTSFTGIGTAWMVGWAYFDPPGSAAFARICLEKSVTSTSQEMHFDVVEFGAMPVPDVPWTAPSLLNSWTDVGSPYHSTEYMVDHTGTVYLRGRINSGTVADSDSGRAFVPVGAAAPASDLVIPVASNGAFGLIRVVGGTGAVRIISPSNNTWVSLDGVSYRVR